MIGGIGRLLRTDRGQGTSVLDYQHLPSYSDALSYTYRLTIELDTNTLELYLLKLHIQLRKWKWQPLVAFSTSMKSVVLLQLEYNSNL